MAYKPTNANGQATMANSEPVVIASDQTTLSVKISDGTNTSQLQPYGHLRTAKEGHQLLLERFENGIGVGNLDSNVWTSANVGGISGGLGSEGSTVISVQPNNASAQYSYIKTVPTFKPVNPGFLQVEFNLALGDGASIISGNYRFWGIGTPFTSPTPTGPLFNGYGFEIKDGVFNAVCYSSFIGSSNPGTFGASLVNLTGKQPTDFNFHKYIILFRSDIVYYYIDGLEPSNLVATISLTGSITSPPLETGSVLVLTCSNTSVATNSSSIKLTRILVANTNGFNFSLSDPTYPWRKASISSNGKLQTESSGEGIVSIVNSSIITLNPGVTFTGTSEDITNYASITINVMSSVASAIDGLSIQQSIDGTNWDILDTYTVPAITGKTFGMQCSAKFFRIVYTNGGTGQSFFRLQTVFHKYGQRNSAVKPQDARTNDNDFSENLAYLMGYNGTSWDRLRSSISGGLKVDTTPNLLFKGRTNSFRIPGRAGTIGQNLLSFYNISGSVITVKITKVFLDYTSTVVKAVTVLPPIIRIYKVAVLPTNGTVLLKNKILGSTTSNASIEIRGNSSADGTNSATTLTATLPSGAILTQEYAPRLITAVGYEPGDRLEFFGDSYITLTASEGIVLALDYVLATQNPITDQWLTGIEWTEE